MEKLLNKRNIIICLSVVILIVVICTFFSDFGKKSFIKDEPLDIKYEKNKVIEISKVTKGLLYTNKVSVANNNDKDMYYSIKWKDVKNSFVKQGKLLYKFDTHDPDAIYIGDSQAPISGFTLADKVLIKKGTTHTYEITIKYTGNSNDEKSSSFKGIVEITQNK